MRGSPAVARALSSSRLMRHGSLGIPNKGRTPGRDPAIANRVGGATPTAGDGAPVRPSRPYHPSELCGAIFGSWARRIASQPLFASEGLEGSSCGARSGRYRSTSAPRPHRAGVHPYPEPPTERATGRPPLPEINAEAGRPLASSSPHERVLVPHGLATRSWEGDLKTEASRLDQYGGGLVALVEAATEHWVYKVLGFAAILASLAGLVALVIGVLHPGAGR